MTFVLWSSKSFFSDVQNFSWCCKRITQQENVTTSSRNMHQTTSSRLEYATAAQIFRPKVTLLQRRDKMLKAKPPNAPLLGVHKRVDNPGTVTELKMENNYRVFQHKLIRSIPWSEKNISTFGAAVWVPVFCCFFSVDLPKVMFLFGVSFQE